MKLKHLINKKLINIQVPYNWTDRGLILTFEGGDILKIGYSACEGVTMLNDIEMDVTGTFDPKE